MEQDTPPPGLNDENVDVDAEEEIPSFWTRFWARQNANSAIYNDQVGTPIGLFHPIFDSFLAGLDSTESAPPAKLEDTINLLERLQAQDGTELGYSGQMAAIVPGINELLGVDLLVRAETKADGTVSAQNDAICLIAELKAEGEIGSSDSLAQGVKLYAEYWSNPILNSIRKASCCPSFVLVIAGPWMRVLGAIMLARPVIQPLTPLLWVGNKSNLPTQLDVHKLARIFASLSTSITELTSFYDNLDRYNIDPTRFHPYIRHFEVNGHRTDFEYIEAVSSSKLVFEARTSSGTNQHTVIIKFAQSYHVGAHRLLAEAQLAPALLFASTEHGFKVGGHWMIVMEKVRGKNLLQIKTIPGFMKMKVSDALELLHGRGIVYGDLRRPNVMAVLDDQRQPVGGMLVDFDWCGKDGEATYPSDINMKIDWPAGVGPGKKMGAEHDWKMLEKMFPS
ncbi:hypothetical protein BDV93DRAFT_498748 [Ceratobasidium sp. AG-I]|nr:hypothetical protein BDV93DRAFT_498748 [Ceratobasidium sp. AG-I]